MTWIQSVCKLCSCIPCGLWVLGMLFCFKNKYHVDVWLGFNQYVSCAHAYPVYYEFWACYFWFKNTYHTDVWLGFNQHVSCAHAYPVYYEFWACYFFFKFWCLTWIQPVRKLCSCIPRVVWVLGMLFCFKNKYHVDVWLGFNQDVSCAQAYPVYYEFWACYFWFKNTYHTDVWLGFNQDVSCAQAYPVYYEFWACYFWFKNTYHTDVWLRFN